MLSPAVILLMLNGFDAVLTLWLVSNRQAVEANGIMQTALEQHPLLFVSVKMLLVSFGVILLERFRPSILWPLVAVYFLVVGRSLLYVLGGPAIWP